MTENDKPQMLIAHVHKQDQTGLRPDSLEFGPANNRMKVYLNVADRDEAERLLNDAFQIQEIARRAMIRAGYMRDNQGASE